MGDMSDLIRRPEAVRGIPSEDSERLLRPAVSRRRWDGHFPASQLTDVQRVFQVRFTEAKSLGHAFTIGDVTDGGHDQRAFLRLDRAEANLDWNFSAVLPDGRQLEARTHRPRACGVEVPTAVYLMSGMMAFGHQHLDGAADQFIARISKQPRHLGVDRHDPA